MHSVVEYLGFGRFDDIIDPFADIREVRKAYCSLKMGGLLFLGIPVCVDSVYYPVKRCYGRIRLPLITQGFKVLYYFENNKPTPNNLSVSLFQSKERYVMFVLKKS
uniref:Methyltransferase type 11 domain-containing protein n=1 Tax=Setaria digitata TaxID=48799 RepID=A0A915PN62_9BILA